MAKKKRQPKKGIWSREEIRQLKKEFPRKSTAEVAAELSRPLEAVKKKASRMGLRKSKTYLKSLGRS